MLYELGLTNETGPYVRIVEVAKHDRHGTPPAELVVSLPSSAPLAWHSDRFRPVDQKKWLSNTCVFSSERN